LNYGYTEYIRETLDLLGINVNNLEMKEYENWTPYLSTDVRGNSALNYSTPLSMLKAQLPDIDDKITFVVPILPD